MPKKPGKEEDEGAKYTYLKIDRDMQELVRGLSGVRDVAVGLANLQVTAEALRAQQSSIVRMVQQSESALSYVRDIGRANEVWLKNIGELSKANALTNFVSVHSTWLKGVASARVDVAAIVSTAGLALSQSAYQVTVAERMLNSVDLRASVASVASPSALSPIARQYLSQASSAYRGLANSLGTLPQITRLPTFVLPETAREIFTSGHALRTYYLPEQSQDADEIELTERAREETSANVSLLRNIDPGLVAPYVGAHEALVGGNRDSKRHVLSSLRELWNHLLRTLAPDVAVVDWAGEKADDLFHEGKPTRRARMLYICRGVDHEPLSKFVDKDTEAFISMVDAFSRVHELETGLTDEQVAALVLKADSWLMYILRIAGTST
jgi:hypothetical protein